MKLQSHATLAIVPCISNRPTLTCLSVQILIQIVNDQCKCVQPTYGHLDIKITKNNNYILWPLQELVSQEMNEMGIQHQSIGAILT